MTSRLKGLLRAALESLWFVPLSMLAVSQALVLPALLTGAEPSAAFAWLGLEDAAARVRELESGYDAGAARDLLTMVAGGMVTVISIVFSLSFVALTLTSQQIGPRIIDFWLQANVTQSLLGLSLSGFFASLSGLLVLTQGDPGGAASLTAVAIASVLGSLTLVAVVLFATRMSEAIRADATVARVGDMFVDAVEGDGAPRADAAEYREAQELEALARTRGRPIAAASAGYLSSVDLDGLADWARGHGLRLALVARENDHLLPGAPLALAVGLHDGDGGARSVEDALRARLALTPRRRRTGVADFEGDALSEIAMRALSPSLNDPFTAMACLDRILEGCIRLAHRGPPSRLRRGLAGAPADPPDHRGRTRPRPGARDRRPRPVRAARQRDRARGPRRRRAPARPRRPRRRGDARPRRPSAGGDRAGGGRRPAGGLSARPLREAPPTPPGSAGIPSVAATG